MRRKGFQPKICVSQDVVDNDLKPFEFVLRNTPVSAFLQDCKLRYTWVNNPVVDQPVGALVGKTDEEIFTTDDAVMLREIKQAVLDTRQGQRREIRLRVEGRDCYFDLTVEPFCSQSGELIGVAGTAVDVTRRREEEIERARAEAALRDSEARYRMLSKLTSDYAFSYRVKADGNHEVEWKSGAFERITGYSNDEVDSVADWDKFVHPDDRPTLRQLVADLLTDKPCSVETRFITKQGQTRWVTIDAQPIWDEQQGRVVRVMGAVRDITERRRAEEDRQQLMDRLKAERLLVEEVIEQMPVAVIVVEAPSGKLLYSNAQVEQITGHTGPSVLAKPWQEADFQGFRADGTPVPAAQWPLARALRDGEVVSAEEMQFRHPQEGTMRTLRGSASPVRDGSGRMVAAVTVFYDVTEEKHAQQATKLLARAGRILASSLDYEITLRSIAQLSVPELADWCQIDLVTAQGDLSVLTGVHADAQRTPMIQQMAQRYPVAPHASWGPWAVTRSGEVDWADDIRDDMLTEVAHDETHLRILREAGLRSYISVPLKGRGRVFGVLTFVTDGFGLRRRYNQADVDLATELGRRASMAIDKSLLYRDAQRELAERRATERKLQSLNETLEQRVAERTAEAEHRATQLRALAAELTQTEQRERRQLAQSLHDHLQQLLVAAKLRLHAMIGQFEDEPTIRGLLQIDELLTQSVDASRSLTTELSPPILHDAGLAAALDWLARWMRDKHGLHVTVEADRSANPATEDVRVLLFNATRELLFNVVKHAVTRNAHVTLSTDERQRVCVAVSDEGVGFDPAQKTLDNTGFGLFSIQQRLDVLGGETRIESSPGRGTRIELFAPDTPRPSVESA
ncbi:PAS domain S-box protein [Phycisphaerales bacterium AB-hyl4]|uniref:Oxygen sensor histidine kinase NreB n=1 Tax=Natronomicrosphaera hydrolytica TaxID=3242702 RepID=A0ABV4U542_9BACT